MSEEKAQVAPEPQDTKSEAKDVGPQAEPERTFPARYVEELRQENAARRVEARELREQMARIEQAVADVVGSDAERKDVAGTLKALAKQLEETQAKMAEMTERQRETALRQAVVLSAARAGVTDPDDAWRLADLKAVGLDDDGNVTGVEEAIAELVKAKPYLVQAKAAPKPGATNPAGPGGETGGDWMRDYLTRGNTFGAGRIILNPKE